ncbi:transcription factor IIA subunit alpha [Coemansia sp. Benny D115]|nr:transcription factor IIA subunit alpha [Coemansia sp. Benny D115]
MSNSIVAAIYRYVIDDVVRNVQRDFEGHGVDTSVLEELQRSWEAKIIQSRVASFPGEDIANNDRAGSPMSTTPYVYPSHHSSGTSGTHPSSSGTGNINSAASLASIINNPESVAPTAASLASLAQSNRGQLLLEDDDEADNDRPLHYGSAHHIPQNDGSADDPQALSLSNTHPDSSSPMAKWKALRDARRVAYQAEVAKIRDGTISQVDGASDDDDDEDNDDDAHRSATPAAAGNGAASSAAKTEAPEDAINSDLDDSDEDDDYEGGAEETEHIVLCQYEKVTRSKNKWKCFLRDGIMLVNGRDYLFNRATGEFEW